MPAGSPIRTTSAHHEDERSEPSTLATSANATTTAQVNVDSAHDKPVCITSAGVRPATTAATSAVDGSTSSTRRTIHDMTRTTTAARAACRTAADRYRARRSSPNHHANGVSSNE